MRKDGARVWLKWPAFARWREQELVKQGQTEATAAMRKQLDAAQGGDPIGRKQRADARKAEIEVELLERSSVRIEEAAAVTEKVYTDLRAGLVPFPRTAAPKLIGAKTVIEMEQRLDAEVRRLMETLSAPDFGHGPAEEAKEAA